MLNNTKVITTRYYGSGVEWSKRQGMKRPLQLLEFD